MRTGLPCCRYFYTLESYPGFKEKREHGGMVIKAGRRWPKRTTEIGFSLLRMVKPLSLCKLAGFLPSV